MNAYNNSHFKYYSQWESQDKFIAHLFNFKKNGYFLDIGSGFISDVMEEANNSKFFDEFLNWRGICIDLKYNNYSNRKNTKFYCTDATIINYIELLKVNDSPNIIDYLSIDVDDATTAVLKILPFKNYTFSAITIEHDFYKNEEGEKRRFEQRQILSNTGFHLLCSNVSFIDQNVTCPWEDWWINPKSFDLEKLSFLQCNGQTADNINNRFSQLPLA